MAQEQTSGNLAGWRALVLIGAVGNAVGLIGGAPVITFVAAPLAIIGVIGLMSARRKQRS